MYQLRPEEEEWVEKAKERGFTKLQMKTKLEQNNYSQEKIGAFLEYYGEEVYKQEEMPALEEEEDFKKQVELYKSKPEELSWKKRREVKNWLKNLKKQLVVMKKLVETLKKSVNMNFERYKNDKEQLDKELKLLKEDLIMQIMATTTIFHITHPYHKGVEATKENLKDVNLEDLIELMELNTQELELEVNGKTE